MPTYKFREITKDMIEYDSRKKRIPSWTDRILYKDPGSTAELLEYDAIMDISHSDHKPVYANFQVKFKRMNAQELHKKSVDSETHFGKKGS